MTFRVYSCILKKTAAGIAENDNSTLVTKMSVIIIKIPLHKYKYYNIAITVSPKQKKYLRETSGCA